MLRDLVIGIDHIGVCVRSMDEAGARWSEVLGLPVVDREGVVPQKTEAAFLDCGESSVELVSPMEGNVGLVKFLDKRGDGLHHIAFLVKDITEALRRLAEAGVALIDKAPRPGARGHKVAFLHPSAMGGTLVELVEKGVHP